ncbi:hypothetical protein [Cohnella luojiensis]|uniref:Uncharacterized protein n=1 Tax=Cohnella luojiensis TaxID=652876 RepID=A0A4Y8M777_9BACL|nr:hypothetical protein [Cohnella luojiensis]TFE31672.1 hypothetical protein E2980_00925 [Cohnella luojiensis]
MERLISFLMHNFYFVIIVVGIIYSLFFRKSPLERPPNRMPDFGGGGQNGPRRPGELRPPVAQPTRTEPADTHFPAPQRQTQPNPVKTPSPIRVSTVGTEDSLSEEAQRKRVAVKQPESKGLSRPDRTHSPALTPEDLTRAVVWAEILGPPRARRPFRR